MGLTRYIQSGEIIGVILSHGANWSGWTKLRARVRSIHGQNCKLREPRTTRWSGDVLCTLGSTCVLGGIVVAARCVGPSAQQNPGVIFGRHSTDGHSVKACAFS